MLTTEPAAKNEFDQFAADYDATLNRGLAVSGEDAGYFAERRIEWTGRWVPSHQSSILDFGCGVGRALPYLDQNFHSPSIAGFDPSTKSIEIARQHHSGTRFRFRSSMDEFNDDFFSLVYCNGVFHHIPIANRADALETIFRVLAPGGHFVFWENNPGTQERVT